MMWKLSLALMLAVPAPALACSPVPPPKTPPTQAEIDMRTRASFASATDLIDYVVVKRATSARNGTVRVTRSYKGTVRAGAVLPISTSDGAACGSGDAPQGERGRMFLWDKAPYPYNRLPKESFDAFVRLKLVPAR